MNTLLRSQILKEARNSGWHNVITDSPEQIELCSVHRPGTVTISLFPDYLTVDFSNDQLNLILKQSLAGYPLDHQGFFKIPYSTGNLSPSLPMLADVLQGVPARAERGTDFTVTQEAVECFEPSGDYLGATASESIATVRVGQGEFRKALLEYWGGTCAVTGIKMNELLKASHSKPWALCESDRERLDPFNGFLLCAHLDSLYDAGFISFLNSGDLVISPKVPQTVRSYFKLDTSLKLRKLEDRHLPYLRFHQEKIFQGAVY